MKIKEKRLVARIKKLLINTNYRLVYFKYDYKTFGNITIRIESAGEAVNILTDRGEIYFNGKGVFYPLISPLVVDTIDIIIAVLLRDYLMILQKPKDLSNYKLSD